MILSKLQGSRRVTPSANVIPKNAVATVRYTMVARVVMGLAGTVPVIAMGVARAPESVQTRIEPAVLNFYERVPDFALPAPTGGITLLSVNRFDFACHHLL